MATPVKFPGSNLTLNAAPEAEHNVASGMPAFTNGVGVITCWELTPEELKEVFETGRIWCTVMIGRMTQYPMFIGDEVSIRYVNADYGLPKKE